MKEHIIEIDLQAEGNPVSGFTYGIINRQISFEIKKFNETVLNEKNCGNFLQYMIWLKSKSFKFDIMASSVREGLAATGLITEKQTLMVYNFIEDYYKEKNHIYTAQALYDAIYGLNNEGERTALQLLGTPFWKQVLQDGNILIEFRIEKYKLNNYILMPEKINRYQLIELMKFNEEIKRIVSKDIWYFRNKPLYFDAYIYGDGHEVILEEMENNIDELIEVLKERVVD